MTAKRQNGRNDCNNSGTISTTSFTDRILGRLGSFVRLSIVDGISDHDAEAYITLFKNAVVASRLSLLDKTKSVMKDAAQKVISVGDFLLVLFGIVK